MNVIIAGELKITQINLVTEFGKVPDEFSWPQCFIKFSSLQETKTFIPRYVEVSFSQTYVTLSADIVVLLLVVNGWMK